MTHIVLACAFGMSTSMLVQRMQDEAAKRGLDVNIRAISETDVKRETGSIWAAYSIFSSSWVQMQLL